MRWQCPPESHGCHVVGNCNRLALPVSRCRSGWNARRRCSASAGRQPSTCSCQIHFRLLQALAEKKAKASCVDLGTSHDWMACEGRFVRGGETWGQGANARAQVRHIQASPTAALQPCVDATVWRNSGVMVSDDGGGRLRLTLAFPSPVLRFSAIRIQIENTTFSALRPRDRGV